MVAVELSAASTRPCCSASATVSLPVSDKMSIISGLPACIGRKGLGRCCECRIDRYSRLEAAQAIAPGDFFRIAFLNDNLIADDDVGNEIRHLHALGRYVKPTHSGINAIVP